MRKYLFISFLCLLSQAISAKTVKVCPSLNNLVVSFITDDIVHVRYVAGYCQEVTSNNTGVCVINEKPVLIGEGNRKKGLPKEKTLKSKSLIVKIGAVNGALTFIDRKTGRTLLAERSTKPHEAEPVVQERIIYDEKSAHMVETANGKVTVKDEIRRDTIGVSTKYRVHFQWHDDEALYGLGSHMEDYMNLRGKTM